MGGRLSRPAGCHGHLSCHPRMGSYVHTRGRGLASFSPCAHAATLLHFALLCDWPLTAAWVGLDLDGICKLRRAGRPHGLPARWRWPQPPAARCSLTAGQHAVGVAVVAISTVALAACKQQAQPVVQMSSRFLCACTQMEGGVCSVRRRLTSAALQLAWHVCVV